MSSQEVNPYAAPKASLEAPPDQGLDLWRDGKILVCRRDAIFPARCIKCNEAAEPPPVRYKLAWHHPGWYVLVFVYVLIYVVVAMLVRKRAEIFVGLCAKHRQRRLWSRIIGWGGLVALIGSIWLGMAYDVAWLAAGGLIAILPWAITAIVLSPQIFAGRIDKESIRVKGCGRDFLASLPEYPG
jgi:hypothetical protein